MEHKRIALTALDRNEALRYMGHRGDITNDVINSLMDKCEDMVINAAVPRYIYKVVGIYETEGGIGIENAGFILRGKDITNHLKGCGRAIIMCATLSSGVDRLIRMAQKRDMAEALAIDALASTAVEQLCNKAEEVMKEKFPDCNFTWRYGIGYGDLPVEQQSDILTLLDAPRKIGLNVTESHMLTPGKSVTAVIGISEEFIPEKKRGCDSCRLNGTCQFRKEGKYCND